MWFAVLSGLGRDLWVGRLRGCPSTVRGVPVGTLFLYSRAPLSRWDGLIVTETGPAMVPNPYRRMIEARKAASQDEADTLRTLLRNAITHLGVAWVGGMSYQVHSELEGLAQDAYSTADAVLSEFNTAIFDQPVEVPSNAWQVRWRNLGW